MPALRAIYHADVLDHAESDERRGSANGEQAALEYMTEQLRAVVLRRFVRLDLPKTTMTNNELAQLIAKEITSRFYVCTDKGIGGEGGYSANFYDDEIAAEKLAEMIEPLLPNASDQPASTRL